MAELGLELMVFIGGRGESPGTCFPRRESKAALEEGRLSLGSQVPAWLTEHPTATAQPGAELGIHGCLQVGPRPAPAAHEEPDLGRIVLRACSTAGTAPLVLWERLPLHFGFPQACSNRLKAELVYLTDQPKKHGRKGADSLARTAPFSGWGQ